MQTNQVHVCLEQPDAPVRDAEYPVDAHWTCGCGADYIYREGFNRGGYLEMDWWEVPPIAVPRQRRRTSLRDRLIGSRKAEG